jgi:predicted RNA-binding Zn ribbon-like protein
MRFDSHVRDVTGVAAELVNLLTPGEAGGAVYVPSQTGLGESVGDVLAGDVRGRPRVSRQQLTAFREIAVAIRAVFVAVDAGDVRTAGELVNRLLLETGARPQLDRTPEGGWSLHFHGVDDSLTTGWAAGCASGLAMAIGSDFAGRLGVCSAERCDRVYVDTSRNSRRRFCSTACQNRVKAAAFRARHA